MQKVAPVPPAEGLLSDAVLAKIRIPFIQRASVVVDGTREDLFVVDLGLRGVFLERAEPLATGTAIEVSFLLPGNEIAVQARCRVAWRRAGGVAGPVRTPPAGIGIEFVEMSARDAERVREHLLAYLGRHPRHRRFLRHPEAEEDA